jgi:hypothetical protein
VKFTPIRALAVIGAALVLMFGGMVAYSAIPSADGTITACMTKASGTVRLIEAKAGKKCRKAEKLVTWNEEGQPGADGTNGTNGTNGKDGTNGTNGVSGYSMESRAASINGTGVGGAPTLLVSIFCPPGKVALGGGGKASLTNGQIVALTASHPQGSFGWDVTFTPADGAPFPPVPVSYTLWVSCASISN